MKLRYFHNIHAGKSAVLYGKGPSLFTHDISNDEGFVRFGVNDAATVYPCDYLIMHDPQEGCHGIFKQSLEKNKSCIFVLPREFTSDGRFFQKYIKEEHIVCWYNKCSYLHYDVTQSLDENFLWAGKGTATAAPQLAHIMGIKKMRLVGMDGFMQEGAVYEKAFPITAEELHKEVVKHGDNFVPAFSRQYHDILKVTQGLMAYFDMEQIA